MSGQSFRLLTILVRKFKKGWGRITFPSFFNCKRKTSCVFSSDNPSFIMITYILLYFSCRTGSAFD